MNRSDASIHAASSGSQGKPLLAAGVIAVAVLVIAAPGLTDGGLGWSDAPNHTFDGIFVLEFVREMPLDHPRDWAEQFYLRFPALGMFVYYPPGFALVEAGMFGLFGVHIVTARVTVMLFAFGAGWLMYRLGRRWFGDDTGLFAALLLVTCPHGALWLNDVMLEWPATFWILLVVFAYQKDRDTLRLRWTIGFGAALVMAFLTKQTAGFILPVLLLHALLAEDRRSYLLRPRLISTLAASIGVIVGYLWLARSYSALPSRLLGPALNLDFYPRHLPEILGWPLLPIALLGLATFVASPSRGPRGLLLLWFVAWTVFSVVIAAKEPRYFFFALPPLMFGAVRFFLPAKGEGTSESYITWKRGAYRVAFLLALIVTQAVFTRGKLTGRLPDYAGAVETLVARPDADLVLVDAVRDGQFLFDIYQNEAARGRIIPLRASKLFYARPARVKWGYEQFVESEEDIVRFLDRYGIRYVVLESALPRTHYTDADPAPRGMLRNLLSRDERFEHIGTWPLRCGDPAWDNVELLLYAYPGCPPRASKTITLSFPAMKRDVTFELP